MIQKKQKNQQKQQKPKKHNSHDQPSELTFLEHIYELRSRLFWVVATIIGATAVGFQFKDHLLAVVMDPLHGQKLVYLTPGGGFSFIFTIAIYFGVLLSIPVIVYHMYRFLSPLLRHASKKLVAMFMAISCLLAAAGAAFGYFVTVPAALDFLETFAGDAVIPSLTAESYLGFVVTYILGLALLFQLPLLLYIFDHIRPFPPGSLLSSQRFVIIAATIIAAVITPTPDVVNMALVAVPIIAIYQLGVTAVFMRHVVLRRRQRVNVEPVQTVASLPRTRLSEAIASQALSAAAAESVREQQQELAKEVVAIVRQKTIDGVIRPRAAQTVMVPAREVSTVRPRMRTIDGLSMI